MDYNRGASRGNQLVRERGLKGLDSSGAAPLPSVKKSDIDRDLRVSIEALLAQGRTHAEIAWRTGASLTVVRAVAWAAN